MDEGERGLNQCPKMIFEVEDFVIGYLRENPTRVHREITKAEEWVK